MLVSVYRAVGMHRLEREMCFVKCTRGHRELRAFDPKKATRICVEDNIKQNTLFHILNVITPDCHINLVAIRKSYL